MNCPCDTCMIDSATCQSCFLPIPSPSQYLTTNGELCPEHRILFTGVESCRECSKTLFARPHQWKYILSSSLRAKQTGAIECFKALVKDTSELSMSSASQAAVLFVDVVNAW